MKNAEKIAYAIRPENELRKKIGENVDIEKVLTPEKMSECQDIIDKAHSDLMEDSLKNLEVLETEYRHAQSNKTPAPHLQAIARLSFVLKGRLEAIGMTMGFEVSKSLHDFLKGAEHATETQMLVIRKHLDVLTAVLKSRIQGDGGIIGKETVDGLMLLAKKT